MGTREDILKQLLGSTTAVKVTETIKKAQLLLEQAKVARKEEVAAESAPGGAEQVDVIAGAVLAALTDAGITDIVLNAENSPVKTPEDLAALLLKAVASVIVKEEQTEEPAAAEAPPAMADEMKSLIKSLGDHIAGQAEDSGVIAQAMLESAGVLKDVVPVVKGMEQRLQAIEKLIGDRPRQASKAAETLVENEAVEAKIKAGIEGEATYLGVKTTGPVNGKKDK
jgi:hypothetical protein